MPLNDNDSKVIILLIIDAKLTSSVGLTLLFDISSNLMLLSLLQHVAICNKSFLTYYYPVILLSVMSYFQ